MSLVPTPPPPQRHTHAHTHSHVHTRMHIHPHTWEWVASWKEDPWNAQLLRGPERRARPQHQPQFPHFPQSCFSPSPLHLSLRGSCTIPRELQMWPRITHNAEEPHAPKASLTHKSTQHRQTPSSNLTNPGLQVPLSPPRRSF